MRTSPPADRAGIHPDAPLHPSILLKATKLASHTTPLPTMEGLEHLAVTVSCYSLGCIPPQPSPTSYLLSPGVDVWRASRLAVNQQQDLTTLPLRLLTLTRPPLGPAL